MQETTDKPLVARHVMLSGERDYEAAIDQVIEAAQTTLHIFDIDMAASGYGSRKRAEALQTFLRKSSKNRLLIVLHDTDRLTVNCPRLLNLLRIHSHSIAINKTLEHARVANDPCVLADEMHYVHRFHRDSARALLAFNDPLGARPLKGRFEQLLEASQPAVFATTLGL